MVVVFIILLILFVVALIWLIKQYLFKREIIRNFKISNVVVDGKRKWKRLTFCRNNS